MRQSIVYPDGEIVVVEYKDVGHSYTVLSPSRYMGKKAGVTTPLKVISKDALAPWAAKMTVEYIKEHAEEASKGLFHVTQEDLKKAKAHHITFRDQRALEGTALHDLIIEKYILGVKGFNVPPEFNDRFMQYQAWELETGPIYDLELAEAPVYSRSYDYCGKPDIPAVIDGEFGIIDLKSGKPDAEWKSGKGYTGKARAYAEHFYQCAAYAQAIYEQTGKEAKWFRIVYLGGENGLQAFVTREVEYYLASWIDTLALYRQRTLINARNPYI